MYEQFHALGAIDITTQPMEVYPTIHYTMGGVWAEPEACATTVPGLFAAGEVAAGLHGANRLGGNSLSDILVFGKRAGEGASGYAKSAKHGEIDTAQIEQELATLMQPLNTKDGESPYKLHQELQAAMQKDCMIARTADGLNAALSKIRELQHRAMSIHVGGGRPFNPGWHAARDVQFMLRTSEIIVMCALQRTESRGAQWRLDFPELDAEWGKVNLVATNSSEGVKISKRPLLEMSPELKAIVEEYK